MVDALVRGREAFEREAWPDAHDLLSSADHDEPLEREDLERLALAAHLVGQDADCVDAWTRAYHAWSDAGERARAARCAFWLGLGLLLRGEEAQSAGWLARAQRLLTEPHLDCVEHGLLLVPAALALLDEGDFAAAHAASSEAAAIGERFGDRDVVALAGLVRGQVLVATGAAAEGVAQLDEVMVAVTAGELSPLAAGLAYCAVIEECQNLFDLRRAQEWTAALGRWCDSQPGLVPYRGQCLVHRSEIMQLHGEWAEAMAEVRRARDRLSDPPGQPAVGLALYQEGELHRLRGELDEAEDAYRRANAAGRRSQPGLALLRLAQGKVDAAAAALRQALEETSDVVGRSKLLAAFVEVMLAAGDVPAARAGADELTKVAAAFGAPMLDATSSQAAGAVLLAESDPRGACEALRRAWAAWHGLGAPYEAARVRVLLGDAYRALGDDDTAELEVEAARATFEQLGATPDLRRLEVRSTTDRAEPAGGLTGREREVLALVAAGRTNRQVAAELVISEHTVARHLQNIFAKLGVSSRTAAIAFAFEHHLV